MFLNNKWIEEDINKLHDIDPDEFVPPVLIRPEHERFAERIRKTLYYGKMPTEDRPSLPMTEMAVNYIRDAAPRELGKIDMYFASEVGRKAYVSPCSMMLGMIYIERLKHKNPEYLDQVSSSDLFLISMMVASKYLYDEGIDEEVYNDEWAEAADVATDDVNQSEREFLRAIDWSLFTKPEDFDRLLCTMEERIALAQGLRRGFWTYSDVLVFFRNRRFVASLRQVLHELCKVVLVCSVAYTAGVVTMVASMTTLSLLRSHCGVAMHTTVTVNDVITLMAVEDKDTFRDATAISDKSASVEREFDETSTDPDDLDSGYNGDENMTTVDGLGGIGISGSRSDSRHITGLDFSSSLTLPGLLTLTLIKDTLTQFILALKIDTENENSAIPDNDGCRVGNAKCSCPRCPKKNQSETKGNWSSRTAVPPYSVWYSMKNVCCCGAKCVRLPSNDSHQGHRTGQGQSSGETLGENQDVADGDSVSSKFRCPVGNWLDQDWNPVPRRLPERLAVDIGTRFQTAAYVTS